MADSFQFDLVSPERRLASTRATAVQMPGSDGDLTAMAGHSPTITTLRPGILRVTRESGTEEFVVSGGFAEIAASSVTILAERAIPRGEMTETVLKGMIDEAREKHERAREQFENEPGPVDDAAKLLADMVAVGDHIRIGGGLAP